jgi:hypothetical protein
MLISNLPLKTKKPNSKTQMGTIWAQSTILAPETGLKTTRKGLINTHFRDVYDFMRYFWLNCIFDRLDNSRTEAAADVRRQALKF